MLVFDASAVLEWLLGTAKGRAIESRQTADSGPHQTVELMDVEVAHVLRKLAITGKVADAHATRLVALVVDVPLDRRAITPLIPRVWELRHNVSAYDATYVALAETLGATLVTCDQRLGNAPGVRARIEVF